MRCFDYESAAKEISMTEPQLKGLCRKVREEFPDDEMLFELHVLRACMAIRDVRLTVEEAVGETVVAH